MTERSMAQAAADMGDRMMVRALYEIAKEVIVRGREFKRIARAKVVCMGDAGASEHVPSVFQ